MMQNKGNYAYIIKSSHRNQLFSGADSEGHFILAKSPRESCQHFNGVQITYVSWGLYIMKYRPVKENIFLHGHFDLFISQAINDGIHQWRKH